MMGCQKLNYSIAYDTAPLATTYIKNSGVSAQWKKIALLNPALRIANYIALY